MNPLRHLERYARRWFAGRHQGIWHSPRYHLPLATIASAGIDPRRADRVVDYLLDTGLMPRRALHAPERIGYDALQRVHSRALLERLQEPTALAELLNLDPSEIVPDEMWATVRLACGGTVAAARHALRHGSAALNLLGGFHHAGPGGAGGFCPVNDVAVAVAALRAEGFSGGVSIIDLDAHPPDGLAECFAGDPSVRIASISGVDWGSLDGVDETVLPAGSSDGAYLDALRGLLARLPAAALFFVIAGGDVVAKDRHGGLALTLAGAAQRDREVAAALRGQPSVWLAGGGYSDDAWRVLAGTATVLLLGVQSPVPPTGDPVERRYRAIARRLDPARLVGERDDEGLVLADLGRPDLGAPRFLGYYTPEGIEYALERYGLFSHLRRLGYEGFRVDLDRDPNGSRARVFGSVARTEHLLIECVLERQRLGANDYLYVHWLTLRNPRARFTAQRPRLPGQDAPGLGLAREAGVLLARAADRLGLTGLLFRPAWYHTALQAQEMGMHFVVPERQGRFEAMVRDLGHAPLLEVTLAVADGRIRMNGAPYRWESDPMVSDPPVLPDAEGRIVAERARVEFERK